MNTSNTSNCMLKATLYIRAYFSKQHNQKLVFLTIICFFPVYLLSRDLICDYDKQVCKTGPSIVSSLMSLLTGQFVTCFRTLEPNTLIFFVKKKKGEAFAAKASYFFDQNNGVFQIVVMFEILTKH